jgi:hypothetical protein
MVGRCLAPKHRQYRYYACAGSAQKGPTAGLQRKQAEEEIALLESSLGPAARRITPERLSHFARLMREALQSGDAAFRKAYLRLSVDTVVVSDTEIRLSGPTASLAKAAATEGLPPAAELVPGFVRKWRPVGDGTYRTREWQKTAIFLASGV